MYTKVKPSLNELAHYGVKGMKWGVRRTPKELRYNRASIIVSLNRQLSKVITKNNVIISKISDHAADQAADRKVSAKEIIDALKKPLNDVSKGKIRFDKHNKPSIQYIGRNATANVNPDNGLITTVWRTGTKKRDKLLRGD